MDDVRKEAIKPFLLDFYAALMGSRNSEASPAELGEAVIALAHYLKKQETGKDMASRMYGMLAEKISDYIEGAKQGYADTTILAPYIEAVAYLAENFESAVKPKVEKDRWLLLTSVERTVHSIIDNPEQ